MSLVRTLAKVAAGVALAQGAKALTQRSRSGGAGGAGGGLMDALQGMRSSGAGRAGGASAGLGALLGGGAAGGAGGLGGIMDSLGGGSGGMNGLAGMLAGGGAGGALAGLMGAAGGAAAGRGTGGGFGDMLTQAMATGAEPDITPSDDEEAMAGLMIRAMIMAAKSDGRIDEGEREHILETLADATPEERAFIQEELNAPIDVAQFAREVPHDAGLRRQIFASAMLAIDLDSQAEAQFMGDLARGLGLSEQDLQMVMRQMGGNLNM